MCISYPTWSRHEFVALYDVKPYEISYVLVSLRTCIARSSVVYQNEHSTLRFQFPTTVREQQITAAVTFHAIHNMAIFFHNKWLTEDMYGECASITGRCAARKVAFTKLKYYLSPTDIPRMLIRIGLVPYVFALGILRARMKYSAMSAPSVCR